LNGKVPGIFEENRGLPKVVLLSKSGDIFDISVRAQRNEGVATPADFIKKRKKKIAIPQRVAVK